MLSLGAMRFGTTTDEETSFAILDRYVEVLACLREDRDSADLMLLSYSDPAEREQLFAALTANSACLARLAASQPGIDPEKLLPCVAQLIRELA